MDVFNPQINTLYRQNQSITEISVWFL